MFLRFFTQAYKFIIWQKLKQLVFLTKQFDFFLYLIFFIHLIDRLVEKREGFRLVHSQLKFR